MDVGGGQFAAILRDVRVRPEHFGTSKETDIVEEMGAEDDEIHGPGAAVSFTVAADHLHIADEAVVDQLPGM